MRGPRSRLLLRATSLVLAVAGICVPVGCSDNPGENPPVHKVTFPSGLMLDPRVPTNEAARWLFVTNANSDRRFNGGSLLAIDLDLFWEHLEGEILPPRTELVYNGNDEANTGFCRRVANVPQTVECLEEPFVAEPFVDDDSFDDVPPEDSDIPSVWFGNFPGPTAAWVRGDTARLLVPVRGEPSVTYIDVSGGLDGDDLRFECGQGDGRRCDDDHRLRFFRNDEDGARLSREPFRVLVSDHPEDSLPPLAYVSHQGDPDVTLIALDGMYGPSSKPAIVHQANLLSLGADALANFQGGFGLAERPCSEDAAPNSTIGCTRPLIYAALRHAAQVQLITAVEHYDPESEDEAACVDGEDVYVGDPGAFVCDPQVEPISRIDAGGLPQTLSPASSRPYLGDIGFSRDGSALYVVQSNPGALLRIDTSLDVDGDTVDLPVGLVEVCAQPTSFAIYGGGDPSAGDGDDVEYGVVTCYRSGEVFIVDLASLTVVGLSRAGIGPDAIAVDLVREAIYVANTLDATISVITMKESDPAQFTEIARIGLQEPYV